MLGTLKYLSPPMYHTDQLISSTQVKQTLRSLWDVKQSTLINQCFSNLGPHLQRTPATYPVGWLPEREKRSCLWCCTHFLPPANNAINGNHQCNHHKDLGRDRPTRQASTCAPFNDPPGSSHEGLSPLKKGLGSLQKKLGVSKYPARRGGV